MKVRVMMGISVSHEKDPVSLLHSDPRGSFEYYQNFEGSLSLSHSQGKHRTKDLFPLRLLQDLS